MIVSLRHKSSRPNSTVVTCLFLTAATLSACRKESPSDTASDAPATTPNTAASESAEPEHNKFNVNPELLTQGRIAVVEVTPYAYAGATLVPGEVTPAPDGEAWVGSLVGGRISSLEAVEGDSVKRGQVLAWIDSPEVGRLQADLVRAQIRLAAAKTRLDRQLELQTREATSQSAIDLARADVLSAQADHDAASLQLRALGAGGAATNGRLALRSPIAGTVVSRTATLGASVSPEATLFRVVTLDNLRVRAHWSEALGALPAVGTPIHVHPRTRVSGAVRPEACSGNVEAHLGLVDTTTRSVVLQIVPNATCSALTPGAYVDVLVVGNEARTTGNWTQVPSEAVVDVRGLPSVFVATSTPGEFELRHVVAKPSVGAVIPIETGVSIGEKVVTSGNILLKGEALAELLGGH